MSAILEVRGLRTHFETARGIVKAVNGVDLSVETGSTLGVVGESGCGKTVLALSLLRLVPSPPGRIVGGSVLLAGRELLSLARRGNAAGSRMRNLDDLPGADDIAESRLPDRGADR